MVSPALRLKFGSTGVPNIHGAAGAQSLISPSSIYPDGDTPRYRYHEYAHIEQRKDIGAFYSINQLDHIKGVVAHELAHFASATLER